MKTLFKRNSREAINRAAANCIEQLEARAYLTGVVLGNPINLATSSIGVSPVFANLTPTTGGFRTGNPNADLFIANQTNSVSVLLGNGNGTFAAPTTIAVSGAPLPLATGDFNGDGKLDIVAGTTTSGSNLGSISIILGNGDGTFQAAHNITAFANNQAIAVGHFVDGGPADVVAVTNTAGAGNNLGIMFGNGAGGAASFATMFVPHGSIASVAVANLGNGHDDIVIVDQADNKVTVILGNGNGTFQAPVDYSVGVGPTSVALGTFDTNANNNVDIVTANSQDGTVSFLPNNGNGTFGTAVASAVGGSATGGGPLKVRDTEFNGDGKRDLLLLLSPGSAGDATVMLGNGDGTFHTGTIIPKTAGHTRDAIAAGDLNGDGLTDAVVSDPTLITSLLNVTNQDTTPPTAAVDASQAPGSGQASIYNFTVTFADNNQVDATTLGNSNLVVTFPDGTTTQAPVLLNSNLGNAASIDATYQLTFPSNLTSANNGVYHVSINANSVKDAAGNAVAAGPIGTFTLAVSATQPPPIPPGPGPTAPSGDLTLGAPAGKLTAAVVGGSKFKSTVSIPVKNTSGKLLTGNVTVTLYASTTTLVNSSSIVLASATKKKVKLKNGKGFTLKVKNFTFPSTAGTYFLVAAATVNGAADSNNSATSAITVAAPFVDINNLGVTKIPAGLVAGKTASVSFKVRDDGNINAKGTAVVVVTVSGPVDANVPVQVAAVNVKISLTPGKSKVFTIHFKPATLPTPGVGYTVSVSVSLPGDSNIANNSATSAGTLSV